MSRLPAVLLLIGFYALLTVYYAFWGVQGHSEFSTMPISFPQVFPSFPQYIISFPQIPFSFPQVFHRFMIILCRDYVGIVCFHFLLVGVCGKC